MASTEVADLPEDVLFEVFSRVGKMKALFRCAVTCKRWLSVFTDPEFLHRLWPGEDRGRLLGFFLDEAIIKRQGAGTTLAYVPAPGSPISYGDCILTCFVTDDHDLFHSVTPLSSHRGILLLRFVIRSNKHVERNITRCVHGLCDPITGAHVVFPPLDCSCLLRSAYGYAILGAADSGGVISSTTFSQKLLLVGHESRDLHIHLYSRATNSWSVATADCILPSTRARELGARAAVVHRGVANWLYDDEGQYEQRESVYMLSVKAGTTRVYLTKLPIRDSNRSMFLCTDRDGRLSVACVHELRVDVWTTQDDDGESNDDEPLRWQQWHKVHEVQIPAGANFSSFRHCAWKCLNSGTLLFLVAHGICKNQVFVLNLETAAVEKVLDLSESPYSSKYYSYMPYKMDLPEFFLGQIGNHHQKRLLT